MTVKPNPHRTARGLLTYDPVKDRSGGNVTLTESSEAIDGFAWLSVAEAPSIDVPGGREASAHLTLDELRQLRDQIEHLLVNHRLA